MQETPILGYTPTTFMFFPLIGLITVWVFFALFCYRRYQNSAGASVYIDKTFARCR